MKSIYTLTAFLLFIAGLSYNIYAGTPASEKHEFKTTDREINFDPERKTGEVVLHFKSSVFNNFEEIIVERSGGDIAVFSTCKTIDIADAKIKGDYYSTVDKFPMSARADSYYRIKTISKDGSMKIFPPVLLEGLNK